MATGSLGTLDSKAILYTPWDEYPEFTPERQRELKQTIRRILEFGRRMGW